MSVKVQYTIPGWEPAPSPAARIDNTASAFDQRLRDVGAPSMITWRQVLRVDVPSPGELNLGPPPLSATPVYTDIHEERRRWHGLLRRHLGGPAPAHPDEVRMLAALARMDEIERELETRIATEGQGQA